MMFAVRVLVYAAEATPLLLWAWFWLLGAGAAAFVFWHDTRHEALIQARAARDADRWAMLPPETKAARVWSDLERSTYDAIWDATANATEAATRGALETARWEPDRGVFGRMR